MALTTLQDIIDGILLKRKREAEDKKLLQAMYDEIHDNGYQAMCEKFNYRSTPSDLHKQMKNDWIILVK